MMKFIVVCTVIHSLLVPNVAIVVRKTASTSSRMASTKTLPTKQLMTCTQAIEVSSTEELQTKAGKPPIGRPTKKTYDASTGRFTSSAPASKAVPFDVVKTSSTIKALTAPSSASNVPARAYEGRHAHGHKKWGVDNTGHDDEYWFDARIHTLGNVGFSGAVHAALAPISTKLIDVIAYDGIDLRLQVAEELSKTVGKGKARVLDLCCGVGISTRALRDAFPDAETVTGLDTSKEMLAMANFLTNHLTLVQPLFKQVRTGYAAACEQGDKIKAVATTAKRAVQAKFINGNAEDTKLPGMSFDLVTVMYAFHEAPKKGRDRILAEARRLLQPGGTLAVVDISTDYTPSDSMLMGEPYVLEYQQNIHSQLGRFKGFSRPEYRTLVPGHVGMWLMKRAPYAV